MLALAVRNTKKLVRAQVKENNIRIGRFFTKKEHAALMASLPSLPEKETVSLLDPGAGTGILSAAMAERLAEGGRCKEIRLVCYENDPLFLPMLKDNLERVRKKCRHDYKVRIRYTVREENYVLADREPAEGVARETFDIVIMNPPRALMSTATLEYKKYRALCSGDTDLAYLFLAAAAEDLAEDGQIVAMLPLVFSSGAYLSKMRRALLSSLSLRRVHLFLRHSQSDRLLDEARKDMILLFSREPAPEFLRISTSYDEDPGVHTVMRADYGSVVRPEDGTLLLLKSAEEAKITDIMAQFPCTLSSLGLRMKTGLTLESRYPTLLRDAPSDGAVPLIHPNSIQQGQVVFPRAGVRHQFLSAAVPSLLQRNKNILLVRRVPAKSDKKALCCGIYLASQLPRYRYISTQNKLNYIDYEDDREMDFNMVFGLYVVLNSSLYGKYYQVFSKSKQINATEFADLPLPSAAALRAMGARLSMCRAFNEKACDNILLAQMKSGKI